MPAAVMRILGRYPAAAGEVDAATGWSSAPVVTVGALESTGGGAGGELRNWDQKKASSVGRKKAAARSFSSEFWVACGWWRARLSTLSSMVLEEELEAKP